MNIFSRKIVTFLIVVFWQSSLGTKSSQISSQNLGQNGYRKYEDGLLVQWGYFTNASAEVRQYISPFPFMMQPTDLWQQWKQHLAIRHYIQHYHIIKQLLTCL